MSAPLLWFLLGLVFLFAELTTPALVLLFFGVGAWGAACVALLGLPLNQQIITFIIVSLLTLFFLRRRVRTIFGGRSRQAESQDAPDAQGTRHQLTGRTGVVSKSLHPDQVGEVSIDGSYWRAEAEVEIPEGHAVRVLGARPDDALVLRVCAAEASNTVP